MESCKMKFHKNCKASFNGYKHYCTLSSVHKYHLYFAKNYNVEPDSSMFLLRFTLVSKDTMQQW